MVFIVYDFNTVCWRLPTLAPEELPLAQEGLTSVFGMRTGVTPPIKHQHTIFKL